MLILPNIITLMDSVEVDVALMKKEKGHPLLDVYHSILELKLHGDNKKRIERALITMGERVGKLMGEVEKSMSEESDSGEKIRKKRKIRFTKQLKN